MRGSKPKILSSLFRTATEGLSDSKTKIAEKIKPNINLEQLFPLTDFSDTTSISSSETINISSKKSFKEKLRSKKPPPISAKESYSRTLSLKKFQSHSTVEPGNMLQRITSFVCGNVAITSEAHSFPTSDMPDDQNSMEPALDIPWFSKVSSNSVTERRKELSRERKQKWVTKDSQTRRFRQLVSVCGKRLGTEATLEVFGKLGRETGTKEFHTLIGLCIEKARTSRDIDVSLEHIYKASELFGAMREQGFRIEEETYGPLLTYLIDMEMVEEFQFLIDCIKNDNPDTLARLGYYEMLLWVKVDDKDKIEELCNSIGEDKDGGGLGIAGNYLLALCEGDRNEEFLRLLDVVDVTKVSSLDCLSDIFKSLGRRTLENFAQKFIVALKASEVGEENLSHFIYSYTTSMPDLLVEEAILEFKRLHEKLHVLPASTSYKKLVRYCCDSLEVHSALDIVDQMCHLGLSLSPDIFYPILDAVEESRELDLVQPVYAMMRQHDLELNSEIFRIMINLSVRMKDFEGAYNFLRDLKEMHIGPNAYMYNSIMAGHFREKNIHEGLNVLNQMKRADVKPDSQTYSYLIGYCESEKDIVKYYEELKSAGIQATKHVYMAIITAYVKCGQFQKAKQVFLEQEVPVKCMPELKSVLLSGLASNGQISDALEIYEELKKAGSRVEPKAIISLIEYLPPEGEVNRVIELLGMLDDSEYWFEGCKRGITYCVRHKHLSVAINLLKQLKGKDEVSAYTVMDQVFAQIWEAEPTDLELGIDLLKAIKEEVDLHPSRTSLDFLLSTCVSTKDVQRAWLIWEEYEKAGLVYTVLSYLRMYQLLLASGETKDAKKMLTKIAKDDPHVRRIIHQCRDIFSDPKPLKGKNRKC